MSSALRQPMTVEAFLAWEERQPAEHAFDGIGPVAMTGGTLNHAQVQVNLPFALRNRFQGGPCRPFGSDAKILSAGSEHAPDATVICSSGSGKATLAPNPVVVCETTRPGTDRISKTQEHRDTPAIQRYVILEQDRQAATIFSRDHDDRTAHLIAGDTDLGMSEIGISVPLSELYVDVELIIDPPGDPRADSAA